MAKRLVIDPDKLNERAKEIYLERIWRPGQMPSWENAAWADRRACRDAAREEMEQAARR